MKKIPTWQPVVAAALSHKNGDWLMHQRPEGKHYAGLWEFPGGKVEEVEVPEIALVREIWEELGIRVSPQDCQPAGFAQEPKQEGAEQIVILLYTVTAWEGEPIAQEGGQVGWFSEESLRKLNKPPLDCALADQLFAKEAR